MRAAYAQRCVCGVCVFVCEGVGVTNRTRLAATASFFIAPQVCSKTHMHAETHTHSSVAICTLACERTASSVSAHLAGVYDRSVHLAWL